MVRNLPLEAGKRSLCEAENEPTVTLLAPMSGKVDDGPYKFVALVEEIGKQDVSSMCWSLWAIVLDKEGQETGELRKDWYAQKKKKGE